MTHLSGFHSRSRSPFCSLYCNCFSLALAFQSILHCMPTDFLCHVSAKEASKALKIKQVNHFYRKEEVLV